MKKIILVVILFFMPVLVKAQTLSKDIYLDTIKIDEFEFTPVYDKYQNTYTIISNNYKPELKIYVTKFDETDKISIVGNNNLGYGENKIEIVIYNTDYTKENVYTFYITFENEDEITTVFQITEDEETKNIGIMEVSCVVFGCYVLIISTFKFLFFR